MEQANLVDSSQREKQFRNRVIGAGVATLAILAPNSSPANAITDPLVVNMGPTYCKDKKMTFDYSIQNNSYPGMAAVDLTENDVLVKEESVPPSATVLGSYATNLAIGSAVTYKFIVDGQQVGFEKPTLVKNCLPPPKDFEPIAPNFIDAEGVANDTVIIPTYEGVNYFINNEQKLAGSYHAEGLVRVDARVAPGWVFNGPQEATWTFNFTGANSTPTENVPNVGNEDDVFGLPTPSVISAKFKNKKVAKKNKKTCKKLVKARDDLYDSKDLKRKDYKFLKTKCKIKYPKILYSNKKTKVYEGIPYSWGVKPVTTGGVRGKIDILDARVFPDGVNAADPKVAEHLFTAGGKIKWINSIARKYYSYSSFYGKKGLNLISDSEDEPKPYKSKASEVVDTQISQKFCNNSDEKKSITAGIKKFSKNPTIITERSFSLNPGECRIAVVSDSAGLPPSDEEAPGVVANADRYFVDINPNKDTSLQFRSTKKGIYYYRVNSANGSRYYQRSILTGVRAKTPGEKKPYNDPPRYISQDINRGW